MSISLFYQNLRGIRTKTSEFHDNLLNLNSDFFCLTETWLNSNFLSTEYISNNLISYRKDRNYDSTGTVRGGGCWIFHKPDIDSVRRYDLELNMNFIEDIWIQVKLANSSNFLFICTVYITPMLSNNHLYTAFADKVKDNIARHLNANDRILILGDFNLTNLKWLFLEDGSSEPFSSINCEKSNDILNLMHFGNLSQYNSIANDAHNHNILDLVLSSDPFHSIKIERHDSCLVKEDDYHPPLEITLQAKLKFLPVNNHRKYKFHRANYDLICKDMEEIDWKFIEDTPITNST